MNPITITAALITLLSPFAFADRCETLAGYRDLLILKKREAALALFVTDTPIVQYQKTGKRPVQLQLGKTRRTES
ncbi:MAG: hypothetical protein OSB65_08265 [Roseibacillus sp.]|nr:hypothetical protein [Roseibacillus sp.]